MELSRRARGHLRTLPLVTRLPRPLRDVARGIWLGLLDEADFAALDETYYSRRMDQYAGLAHITSGLFAWEQPMFDGYLPDGGRVLVAAAGSGRELVELTRRGFRAEGFESHPGLRAAGVRALAQLQVDAPVAAAPRDHCPPLAGRFDAIVIGWGAYMCVPTAAARVAFLRDLRRSARGVGTPLLLSFFHRRERAFGIRLTAAVARPLRRLRAAPAPALGDTLTWNFVHGFTGDEIRRELAAGGFALVFHGTTGYGYAVARVRAE